MRPTIHIASANEYRKALRRKLQEEVTEFLKAENPEELADILEVIYALASLLKHSPAKLEKIRKKKAVKRGGFKKRIILEKIIQNTER